MATQGSQNSGILSGAACYPNRATCFAQLLQTHGDNTFFQAGFYKIPILIEKSQQNIAHLIAAMTPCPCGYYGDSQKPCTCAPAMVTKYQKRISGPLLDRIGIHIEVPRVDYEKLSSDRVGETSKVIRQRVQAARDIQNKRFTNGEAKDVVCNADMRVGEVRLFCSRQPEGRV